MNLNVTLYYVAYRIYEYVKIGFLILLNTVDFDYNKLSNSLEDFLVDLFEEIGVQGKMYHNIT